MNESQRTQYEAKLTLALASHYSSIDVPAGIFKDGAAFSEWLTRQITAAFVAGARFATQDSISSLDCRLSVTEPDHAAG